MRTITAYFRFCPPQDVADPLITVAEILDFRLPRRSVIQNVLATVFLIFLAAHASVVAATQQVDHSAWDVLLHRYTSEGRVDYAALAESRSLPKVKAGLWDGPMEQAPGWMLLTTYLDALKAMDPAQLPSKEARLAFWINAYNACVFKGVLDHYSLKSVKDVKGFFDKVRYEVAGGSMTLNEIEAKGRALGDWRIHFGVVCGAWSCPPLRSEAYVPERVDAQLTDQVKRFLADAARGQRLDVPGETWWVSKIFKWYAKDFIPNGQLNAERLFALLTPFLEPGTAQAIGRELTKDYVLHIRFLDYDWSLNAQR